MKHTAQPNERGFLEITMVGPNTTEETIRLGEQVITYSNQMHTEGKKLNILLNMTEGDVMSGNQTMKASALILKDINKLEANKFAYICPDERCSKETNEALSLAGEAGKTTYREFSDKVAAIDWLTAE